ncbi:MAG TPA: hypothetical protein QGF58_25525 [Myxococcota bacterium]|nr:hypothetical protein [Myxococcota bacterium]
MLQRALLIGASGRLRFNGHVRFRVGDATASADIAARVAAGCPPVQAWAAVVELHRLLHDVPSEGNGLALIAEVIRRLDEGAEGLGPARGEDLALLIVASDELGWSWAGRGLARVWTVEGLRPVQEGEAISEALVALGEGDPEPRDMDDIEALVG